MAYRTQQYVATNRAFGPYLPPYPLQGLGAADCSAYQNNLNYATQRLQEANNAMEGQVDNPDLQAQLQMAQNDEAMAKSDLAQCLQVGPAPISPNVPKTCPAGQQLEDNGWTITCVPIPPGPTPPGPQPYIPPKPPTPTPPTPVKPAATPTNWLLIGGVVAAVGVVGYLAFMKGGTKGGYHVASNPRRRSRRY